MGNLKALALKRVAAMLGIPEDASLPELVELVNEHTDLGLSVQECEVAPVTASNELMSLAHSAERALRARTGGNMRVKFYKVTTAEGGKAPVSAFIVVGA